MELLLGGLGAKIGKQGRVNQLGMSSSPSPNAPSAIASLNACKDHATHPGGRREAGRVGSVGFRGAFIEKSDGPGEDLLKEPLGARAAY